MPRKTKKLGVKTSKSAVFDDDSFEVNEAVEEESDVTKLDIKEEEEEEDDDDDGTLKSSEKNNKDLDKICSVLDRLTLDMFILMQRQMQYKLNIEKSMTAGELHLAKSRYIMGHKNVSVLQLPTENSLNDIDPSITLEEEEEISDDDPMMFGGKPHLKLNTEKFTTKNAVDNNDEEEIDMRNVQDPIHWFGVLVPRDLRLAQDKFKDALGWAVDCANTQIRLHQTCAKINQLTTYKHEQQQQQQT